jgi:hypothetical protein
MVIKNYVFHTKTGNSQNEVTSGGALFIENSLKTSILSSEFILNRFFLFFILCKIFRIQGNYGAAITVTQSYVELYIPTITNNTGGGIFCSNSIVNYTTGIIQFNSFSNSSEILGNIQKCYH